MRRLGFVYIPMGAHIAAVDSARQATSDASFRPLSRSLAPVNDQLTVVTNLELKNAYPGTHATSNAAFLSAATSKWTESTDYELGTTVDQIAAQHIGRETRLPSLELAMDLLTTVGQCDNGYACVYQNNLSWSSPTTPLPAEAHPRIAFERLFGDGGSAADRLAELRKNASLLDWVTRRYRAPAEEARPRRPQQGQPVSGYRSRSGAPHSEGRSADGRYAPAAISIARSACRRLMPTTPG